MAKEDPIATSPGGTDIGDLREEPGLNNGTGGLTGPTPTDGATPEINPFEGNSPENRLLYILEKDNVDFSKISREKDGRYSLFSERGMGGGKIITILRQQAADEVDIATADLDSIRSEYSIGTYLMVPPLDYRAEMHEDLGFDEHVWYRVDGNRWTMYPIGYPWD